MIEAISISKNFKLPHETQKTIFHRLTGVLRHAYVYEEFFALRDVSFKINKGEFLGIIGRNGSGKTTLLRIISGILRPTTGNISVNEAITPILDIGVGFQSEFTCRENIYIYGALLGFSRKEMDKRFKSIMEFAELESFADVKLNRLSTGMQVRLAFTIAIQSSAPILIVDEVMAVGDNVFQQKCRDVFWKYKKEGRTVILVSHNLSTIEEYCDKVLVFDKGTLVNESKPCEAIHYYKENILKSII